jgi:putative sugar O-methyltransferase
MWLISEKIKQGYISVCDEACEDENIFSSLKSLNSYNQIVGMSNVWQGEAWLEKIKEDEEIKKYLQIFKNNDICNPPNIFFDKEIGEISPSTLRYVYNLIQIKKNLEEDKNKIKNILEIGTGYGGMCYVASTYYNLEKYYLVDLPQVKNLCQKYLLKLNVKNFCIDEPSENEKFDLLISEYCFSEFDDDFMMELYEKYLLRSDRLFLVVNFCENEKDQKRRQQWLQKIEEKFYVTVQDEFPESPWKNYVWYCKKKGI